LTRANDPELRLLFACILGSWANPVAAIPLRDAVVDDRLDLGLHFDYLPGSSWSMNNRITQRLAVALTRLGDDASIQAVEDQLVTHIDSGGSLARNGPSGQVAHSILNSIQAAPERVPLGWDSDRTELLSYTLRVSPTGDLNDVARRVLPLSEPIIQERYYGVDWGEVADRGNDIDLARAMYDRLQVQKDDVSVGSALYRVCRRAGVRLTSGGAFIEVGNR
jgi:hypothetical protein